MNNKEILEYWNREDIESMYDKHLINLEILLIKNKLKDSSKILDAGCGEGEGTLVYANTPNSIIHACDFSETRLRKAKILIGKAENVLFKQLDFINSEDYDYNFDFIISQRFLINILEWDTQKVIIKRFINHLKPGGKLLLLEGSKSGVNELNHFREILGLSEIPVRWHNLFFEDDQLEIFLKSLNCEIIEKDGLGDYFLLTRGIKPYFEKDLSWDTEFNKIASSVGVKNTFKFKDKFSRLKLWVVEKKS